MHSGSETSQAIDDALEVQYALRQRHPERDDIYRDHQERSLALRAAGDCQLDLRYGGGPRCLLDVFPAGKGAPVFFFIHGGYWRALDKSYVSFIAEHYRKAGMTVVMPTYDLVPAVRVGDIIEQIRAALRGRFQVLGRATWSSPVTLPVGIWRRCSRSTRPYRGPGRSLVSWV